MLRAGLAGEHHDLLGADALGVDVDDDLQPRSIELSEAEVGHFDAVALFIGEDEPRLSEQLCRPPPRVLDLIVCQHSCIP